MEKVGIFYASSTGNCETIAQLIKEELKPLHCELHDVLKTDPSQLDKYRFLIFGVSTWTSEGTHEDWDEFLQKAEIPKKARTLAMFGLGDQNTYPEAFVNSLGELFEIVNKYPLQLIGKWSAKGYHFNYSKALKDGKFVGLVIDEDAQSKLTKDRVKLWAEQLKRELKNSNDG